MCRNLCLLRWYSQIHHQEYIDDPRVLNKTLYIRPPENILSQRQVIRLWERHIGKQLHKSSIFKQEFLVAMKGKTKNKDQFNYPFVTPLSPFVFFPFNIGNNLSLNICKNIKSQMVFTLWDGTNINLLWIYRVKLSV